MLGQMKRTGQGRGWPVTECHSLEAPGQTLARPRGHAQGGGTGRDHVQRQTPPTQAVPLSLEACRPIGQVMNLVQQQYGSAGLRAGFRFRPATLPEAGQRGARLVASRVDGCLAELGRDVEITVKPAPRSRRQGQLRVG